MKIKIFNLIRTQLHSDTSVWSFPTFAQAREKMFEEVVSEFKIDKDRLATKDEHFVFNEYEVWKGNDYITISDGNKVEYEIKETSMNTYQMQIEAIIGKVMEICPACEKYRELIDNELLCYTEKDLPFYEEDIKHFVSYELEERLSKCAAAKIVSGYDEEFQCKYFQVVADYLEGNRGLSVMLAVMNGEEDAIEDVKKEINKQENKKVFQTDYVWLWKSTWMSGKHFIHRDETRIFKNHDSAYMEMRQKQEEVIKMFSQHYNSVNPFSVNPFEDGNLFQVCDEDNYDVWEGRIIKMYIED